MRKRVVRRHMPVDLEENSLCVLTDIFTQFGRRRTFVSPDTFLDRMECRPPQSEMAASPPRHTCVNKICKIGPDVE